MTAFILSSPSACSLRRHSTRDRGRKGEESHIGSRRIFSPGFKHLWDFSFFLDFPIYENAAYC